MRRSHASRSSSSRGCRRATLDLLSLFDAFEHDAEPYSFRDLILARKYAALLAGGRQLGGDRAVGAPLRRGGGADGAGAAPRTGRGDLRGAATSG